MRRQAEVILVGKSTLLREGLAAILRAANFRIVASVSSADDLRPIKGTLRLPLYLIVHTGDDFDIALKQIALFRNRHADARIAVVADHHRMNELASVFHAGANGYFVNVSSCDRFIRSVELVMMGGTIFPPASLSFILDANRPRLVEAAANDRNGEQIPFAAGDATRARAFSAGESNSALHHGRRLQQMHSAQARHRRSDRKSPRQGDPSQDPSSKPNAGGHVGHKKWIPDRAGGRRIALLTQPG